MNPYKSPSPRTSRFVGPNDNTRASSSAVAPQGDLTFLTPTWCETEPDNQMDDSGRVRNCAEVTKATARGVAEPPPPRPVSRLHTDSRILYEDDWDDRPCVECRRYGLRSCSKERPYVNCRRYGRVYKPSSERRLSQCSKNRPYTDCERYRTSSSSSRYASTSKTTYSNYDTLNYLESQYEQSNYYGPRYQQSSHVQSPCLEPISTPGHVSQSYGATSNYSWYEQMEGLE